MWGARAMLFLVLGLWWCASSFAVGDDEDADALKGELKSLLGSTRGGVKLSAALVLCLVTYFIEYLRIDEVDEVNKDDPEEMEEAASEGWAAQYGADLPKAFALRIRKWAGEVTSVKGPSSKDEVIAGGNSIGNVKEEDRRAAAKELAGDMDLSPFEREKAEKDMAAQGLTCMRIVSLSQSLILGRPVSMSECEGLKYGGDPSISKLSKDCRKAGRRTLGDLIKNKDYSRTAAFFTDCARAYSFDGMTVESSLVSTWWSETAGCFSSCPESLHMYIEDYFQKYAGRGLPVTLDNAILNRLRQSSQAGASKEDVKALKAKSTEAEEENRKLKNRMKALEDRLTNLKPGGGGGKKLNEDKKETPEEYKARRAKAKCHHCDELGHFKWECPQLKEEE